MNKDERIKELEAEVKQLESELLLTNNSLENAVKELQKRG